MTIHDTYLINILSMLP